MSWSSLLHFTAEEISAKRRVQSFHLDFHASDLTQDSKSTILFSRNRSDEQCLLVSDSIESALHCVHTSAAQAYPPALQQLPPLPEYWHPSHPMD